MRVALQQTMTREQFFDWAQAQAGRYEFDGQQPVAMTGGTNNHGLVVANIVAELKQAASRNVVPGSSGRERRRDDGRRKRAIRRYVLVEHASPVVVAYERVGDKPWTAAPLSIDDELLMPSSG